MFGGIRLSMQNELQMLNLGFTARVSLKTIIHFHYTDLTLGHHSHLIESLMAPSSSLESWAKYLIIFLL